MPYPAIVVGLLVSEANTPSNNAVSPARAVVLLVPNSSASVMPYPAIVVGLPVKLANDCAGTLVNASVIPYPTTVVGVPVRLANVCAGTLVKNPLRSTVLPLDIDKSVPANVSSWLSVSLVRYP